ncbi:uncharacterized protein LOC108678510 isoform X1 [Hyalella azteca]|uniref:Uncharacterized protein LOC108678510 isoform X1 n=1 Tax=Hyalella azteca TaxID=294128 RepID=A0A8B7P8S9_HYAAZ|nr:uncharacterized protein LOC108678510 isoform X1 [Hyalella azteca]
MGDSTSGNDGKGGKKKDERERRESRELIRGTTIQKSTGTKLKERWLMTRKTWRYMTDAGKKLFPEGTSPNRASDIPKVQEHFQKTCTKAKEFILWPHHGSPSDDESPSSLHYATGEHEYSRYVGPSGSRQSANIPIPLSQRRPGSILPPFNDPYDENEAQSSLSLPSSPTRTTFSQSGFLSPPPLSSRERALASELAWALPPEIYAQLIRSYGISTLQHVASRLLEEQLMEEDEYEYDEEEGVELLEIDGKRMRSIGAQTDSYLDMCVQTDHDDTAEDMVKVGAETRAETEAAFALSQAQKREELEKEQKQAEKPIPETLPQQAKMKQKAVPQLLQPTQPQPPFQKETPVIKKFWGRRESKGTDLPVPQPPTSAEKSSRGLASEKDREAPPPKGGVAAKLATIEAHSSPGSPPPKEQQKAAVTQQPVPKNSNPPTEKIAKPQEKKSLKNVFKLGLKCDVEAADSPKKNLEKQNADRFKTVNYDKTLRNIKTKWTKEDDENLMRMLAQQHACEPLKELPKKKKRSKAIQVGEALPQFILTAFRVSSPVEIFHATRRRIKRRSSKAESTDFSGSEGSVSIASSLPTSPRYSFTVADDSGTRNLLLTEAEALRLGQMGATIYNKRASLDASLESGDSDRDGLQALVGSLREHPSHVYQRSMSAHQVPSVPCLSALHGGSCRPGGGRYSSLHGFPSSAAAVRGHRASLLQYLLPAVMQRTRTGASGHSSRLVAKRIWRTRSKSQSRASPASTSTWTPMGGNLWLSVTGAVVTLEPSDLLQLTELERLTLQRLALAKIAALNLGCPVTLPKESSSVSSSKKRKPYLLKRKALTTGFFDSKREEPKGSGLGGQVFGLSLPKCLENERLKQQQAAEALAVSSAAIEADVLPADEPTGFLSRKSSHTGSHGSFCSIADGVKQSSTGSLESLNLDRKRPSLISGDAGISELLHVDAPLSQVPSLVTACCNHLLNHGLHTVGIFRVSSSKKRVRQLREEFDQGGEVVLTEEHCPHDVATLLKEFFRDLPEPLLTRDLYEPFLCTQRIRNRKLKLEATQYLLQLLPPANRDTLYALLSFLTVVAEHAVDTVSETGETIPGNMMDSRNLATMFAPNILHMHRAGADNASPAALAAMADERLDCTNVVRSMIDHNKELFEVSAELLDETYHHLMDTHPEALDVMLRRRSPQHDDIRGQQLLQQLLSSLLQPARRLSTSPPYSPGHVGLEGDAESSSSVFDGSECSMSLPRSPTEHNEFDRLKGPEDADGRSARSRNPAGDNTEDKRDRGKCEERKYSAGAEIHVEERGWFRRRDKSSSRELDKPAEEKLPERSRWFRRRDKTSPRNSIDYGIRRKGSDKKKSDKLSKRDERRLSMHRSSVDQGNDPTDSRDHRQRSSSDQTAAQERLRVPEESLRRLSSPEIDSCGVITASLKIPVPLQQQLIPSTSIRESDIPFIEDSIMAEEARTRRRDSSVNTSRPRTGSSDSYLGQPITGTMSFQPLCKKDVEKQSHDSVLSSSSTDMFTLSPSPRNTPVSDFMLASETSSPMSRATSPPVLLSPDSGTPGLSPPPSPPPLLPRRIRRTGELISRSAPLAHSATHTFGTRAHVYSTTSAQDARERSTTQTPQQPITRSRTAEVASVSATTSKDPKDFPTAAKSSSGSVRSSSKASGVKVDVYNLTGSLSKVPVMTEVPPESDINQHSSRKNTKPAVGTAISNPPAMNPHQTYVQSPQLSNPRLLPSSGQQQAQPRRPTGASEAGPTPQLWKRCEIIASNPTDPKPRL